MNPILIMSLILLTSISYADEYETGGGYDAKAAEKEELKAKAIQDKIDHTKEIAEKKRKAKIAAAKKAERERKELLPENMAMMKEHEVCVKAGKSTKSDSFKNWIAELNRRGTKYDELSIRNKNVKINGFECDIFAAYGLPDRYNRTVNSRGTSVQFVYNRTYIYTDNGIITAWSD